MATKKTTQPKVHTCLSTFKLFACDEDMQNRLYYVERLPDYISEDAPPKLLKLVARSPSWTTDPNEAKVFRDLEKALAMQDTIMGQDMDLGRTQITRGSPSPMPEALEMLREHFYKIARNNGDHSDDVGNSQLVGFARMRFGVETQQVQFVDRSMLELTRTSSKSRNLPF